MGRPKQRNAGSQPLGATCLTDLVLRAASAVSMTGRPRMPVGAPTRPPAGR